MYDILTIGNISIDLYFSGETLTKNNERFQLAIGGKYFADKFHEDIGGGGCNVAAGLSKHNYKVAVFGKIGNNPFKEAILNKLADKKVSSEFCQYEDNYFKISCILLADNGERTIINYETPSNLWKAFNLNDNLKQAKNIYVGPLPHINIDEKNKIINHFKGDQALTFVNLADTDCRRPISELKTIFDGLDILIINTHEFAELVKKEYSQINFKISLLNLLTNFENKTLILTDAEKGSYGYFQDKVFYQEAIKPVKIMDTTGCGDAYTAGFIAQYIKTKDIKTSMLEGAKSAAEKLGRIGAN